jgi:hypothetical protein
VVWKFRLNLLQRPCCDPASLVLAAVIPLICSFILRRSVPLTPSDRSKSQKEQVCPSCAVTVLSGASFCHVCGASLAGRPGGRNWPARILVGLGAFAGLSAVAMIAVVTFSERDSTSPSSSVPSVPMSNAPPAVSSGRPPDLSRMTPRQAADRLFNRIMTASEQGNRAEALRFVPMAVQAYGNLVALDRDAHYHLALIHGVAGDRANVDRQIAALRQNAPNHLLALVLEHDTAKRSGDHASVSRVIGAFTAAYDAEITTGKPEYKPHRNTIEKFRAATKSQTAPSR